jgi:hypothetical protein
MAKPNNPVDMEERRKLLKLLDRLDTVDPKCMPDIFVSQWLRGDADARRKIEEEIDRLPRRSS